MRKRAQKFLTRAGLSVSFRFISNFALCYLRFTRPITAQERQDNHSVIFLHPGVGQIKEFDLIILLLTCVVLSGLFFVPGIRLVFTPFSRNIDLMRLNGFLTSCLGDQEVCSFSMYLL